MVLIMSATPLHVKDIGETIKLVGTIISYHTLGMFFTITHSWKAS
jgi:hypothetical protein